MRKLFAIGTLLLSSAAVMVVPAAASERNAYVNNQNYSHGYSAPAAGYASNADRGRFDREAQARLDQRVREQRLERERHERSLHDVRYVRSFRDGC